MRLASCLAKSPRFQGVTLDGEPESYAAAHNILEIEESCRRLIELVQQVETEGTKIDADGFASEILETVRHIHYHILDDQFLRLAT
jgi:hypothetical protein